MVVGVLFGVQQRRRERWPTSVSAWTLISVVLFWSGSQGCSAPAYSSSPSWLGSYGASRSSVEERRVGVSTCDRRRRVRRRRGAERCARRKRSLGILCGGPAHRRGSTSRPRHRRADDGRRRDRPRVGCGAPISAVSPRGRRRESPNSACRARVGESYRTLAVNSSRTVVASASNAVLVNGFPVILSIVSGDDRVQLGSSSRAHADARADPCAVDRPAEHAHSAIQRVARGRAAAHDDPSRRTRARDAGPRDSSGSVGTERIRAVLQRLRCHRAAARGSSSRRVAWQCSLSRVPEHSRPDGTGRSPRGGFWPACLQSSSWRSRPVRWGPGPCFGLIVGPLVGAAYHLVFGARD